MGHVASKGRCLGPVEASGPGTGGNGHHREHHCAWTDRYAPDVGLWPDRAPKYRRLDTIPLKRVGELRELAVTASFLESPAGGYVTGATIDVEGGLNLR